MPIMQGIIQKLGNTDNVAHKNAKKYTSQIIGPWQEQLQSKTAPNISRLILFMSFLWLRNHTGLCINLQLISLLIQTHTHCYNHILTRTSASVYEYCLL